MQMFRRYGPKDAEREGRTKETNYDDFTWKTSLRYSPKDAKREGRTKELNFDECT